MKKVLLTVAVSALLAACGLKADEVTPGAVAGTAAQNSSVGVSTVTTSTGATSTFLNLSTMSMTGAGLSAPKAFPASISSGNKGLDTVAALTGELGGSRMIETAVEKARAAAKAGAKTVAPLTACTDGGTYLGAAVSGSDTSFTVTFTNCKKGGNMYDGVATVSTASSVITTTFAGNSTSAFTIKAFTGNYNVEVLKMDIALTIVNTTSSSGTAPVVHTYAMLGSGTISLIDYININTYSMTFKDFKTTAVWSASTSYTATLSGKFGESWTEDAGVRSITVIFKDFQMASGNDGTNTTLSSNGTVSIVYTPASACKVLTMTIATASPIKFVNSTNKTYAGSLTVNTTATVTFNSDGTVTVSDGVSSTSYTSPYDMGTQCPFADPNSNISTVPLDFGHSPTGIVASKMTVTSKTTAGASATSLASCYTDLHVNYYDKVAPTAATVGKWYIDYHSTGCTNPTTFAFEQAADTDADGICDVGLDINGGWTDDKSGSMEHFVALKMPVGYYVISMNNYSCPADTKNAVTLQLGGYAYGPYNATYTTASADGTNLGGWFRVRDMRVNADKTVDILSPNTALSPWHSGTFGFAPKNGEQR